MDSHPSTCTLLPNKNPSTCCSFIYSFMPLLVVVQTSSLLPNESISFSLIHFLFPYFFVVFHACDLNALVFSHLFLSFPKENARMLFLQFLSFSFSSFFLACILFYYFSHFLVSSSPPPVEVEFISFSFIPFVLCLMSLLAYNN